MKKQNSILLLIRPSPWPILVAFNVSLIIAALLLWFRHTGSSKLILLSLLLCVVSLFRWWYRLSIEIGLNGGLTNFMKTALKLGIVLFIISEVMFFMGFFWAYFHSSFDMYYEEGFNWPPQLIVAFNKINIPFLNTLILLLSGLTVTKAHDILLIKGNISDSLKYLIITIILGLYFTMVQAVEYNEADFTINDSVFSSVFFVATGFHGAHVIVGTIFLAVIYYRLTQNECTVKNHIGLEASIWYWHFVDVVWLFLFISVYWWGA